MGNHQKAVLDYDNLYILELEDYQAHVILLLPLIIVINSPG